MKEKIKRLQKDVTHKEVKHRRVQLLLDDVVALDGSTKCDLDAITVDLKAALGFSMIFVKRIEELMQ